MVSERGCGLTQLEIPSPLWIVCWKKNCRKNHGISKLVGTGDPKEPSKKTHPNPSKIAGSVREASNRMSLLKCQCELANLVTMVWTVSWFISPFTGRKTNPFNHLYMFFCIIHWSWVPATKSQLPSPQKNQATWSSQIAKKNDGNPNDAGRYPPSRNTGESFERRWVSTLLGNDDHILDPGKKENPTSDLTFQKIIC